MDARSQVTSKTCRSGTIIPQLAYWVIGNVFSILRQTCPRSGHAKPCFLRGSIRRSLQLLSVCPAGSAPAEGSALPSSSHRIPQGFTKGATDVCSIANALRRLASRSQLEVLVVIVVPAYLRSRQKLLTNEKGTLSDVIFYRSPRRKTCPTLLDQSGNLVPGGTSVQCRFFLQLDQGRCRDFSRSDVDKRDSRSLTRLSSRRCSLEERPVSHKLPLCVLVEPHDSWVHSNLRGDSVQETFE